MHLLVAQPGAITDGSEAVDLGQTAGEIVVLSAADTELANLAAARSDFGDDFPSVRLANLMQLGHNLSVDLYLETVVAGARLVVVRLLGGLSYWPYGAEQLVLVCRERRIPLALLPGDDQPDTELAELCSLAPQACYRLWQYCVHGGPENARNFLAYAASQLGATTRWLEPRQLLRAGLYWPAIAEPGLGNLEANWQAGRPVAAIVFYRALVQASNLAPVDGLITALQARGVNPLPIFCASLKEPLSAAIVGQLIADGGADLVLNATGFAVSSPGAARQQTPFDATDGPVLQVVFSGGNEAAWRDGSHGLSARDLAMNVALPEVDGRVLTRAVSFKSEARYDAATQTSVVTYAVVPDRLDFVAGLAANWLRLKRTPASDRRVAVILANYPNRDGRLGNGVGLDTPAGTIELLRALSDADYRVDGLPTDGQELIRRLLRGPTNQLADRQARPAGERYPLADYRRFFAGLPAPARAAIVERWGPPERDPFVVGDDFVLAALTFGHVVVAIQPARGYNIDPKSSYHDPALIPPHGYLAFYAWLRDRVGIHAIVHMGKHGNLEWLPGKALCLSDGCYPELALGPLPHLYPFIVNDPGEGTQAKRRAQAVIVDHLTPPLTRAETYGPLAELERLVDEYYEAAGVDPRRLDLLRRQILELTAKTGLDQDCGIAGADDPDTALAKLDNYLCELKEMQIRDGLHVFGVSPEGRQLTDLLVALTRLPRGTAAAGDQSLIRALAADLGLVEFDPLDCDMGAPWRGPRPAALVDGGTWRSHGDTVERLELLASDLVAGRRAAEGSWRATQAVLETIDQRVRPAVDACGRAEIGAMLDRSRWPVRRAWTVRRADPRPGRRAADRAQFLLARYPDRADAGGVAARLEIGIPADRTLPPGTWRLAPRHGAHRLGHREHADRRRRYRASLGADGGAADLGGGLAPIDRLRNPAAGRARSAADRCHAADLRLLPGRLSGTDRSVRFRRPGGCRAGRAGCREPAGRPRSRRPGALGCRGPKRTSRGGAGRLPGVRRQARRLWCRPAGADRRARLAGRCRPRRSVSRLGRLRLWRRRRRHAGSRAFCNPA